MVCISQILFTQAPFRPLNGSRVYVCGPPNDYYSVQLPFILGHPERLNVKGYLMIISSRIMGGTSSSPMDSSREERITQLSKYLSQIVVNQDRSKRGAILDRMVYMFSKDSSKNVRYFESKDDLVQLTHPTFGKTRGFLAYTLKVDDLAQLGKPVPDEIRQRVYTGYTYLTYLLYLFSLIFTVYPIDQESLNRLQDFETTTSGGLKKPIPGMGGGDGGGISSATTSDIDRNYSDMLNSAITTATIISSTVSRDGNALFTLESSNYTRAINTIGDGIRRYVDPLSKKDRDGRSDDGGSGDGSGEGSVKAMKGLLFWQEALNAVNYLSFCDKSPASLKSYLSSSKNAGVIDMMIQLITITIDRIRGDERIRKTYAGEVYTLTSLLKSFKSFETAITDSTSYQEHQRNQLEAMTRRVEEYCSVPRLAKSDRPVVVGDKAGSDDYKKYVKSFSGSAKSLYDKIASAVAKLHVDSLSAFDSVFTISPTRIPGTICFPVKQQTPPAPKDASTGTSATSPAPGVVYLCVKRGILESSDPEKTLLAVVIQTTKSVLTAYANIFYYLRYDLDKIKAT